MEKIRYIDAVRGIAILLVILCHSFHNFSVLHIGNEKIIGNIELIGQMGVQLFFIASAYTLCLSHTQRKGETRQTLKFFIRRFFRIAPGYYIAIILYFLISIVDIYLRTDIVTFDSQYTWKNIISNVLFIHGFYKPANNNIVIGGWSIAAEMFFYLLFPLIISVFKNLNIMLSSVMLIVTGFIVSNFSIYILMKNGEIIENGCYSYFFPLTQFVVFAIGISYYYLENTIQFKNQDIVNILLFALFLTIGRLLWHFSYWWRIPLLLTAFSCAFIFLFRIARNSNFITNDFFIRLGQQSYSLYLVHFIPSYYISFYIVSKLDFNWIILALCLFVFNLLVSKLLVITIFMNIEKRGINLGKQIIDKIK